MVRHKRAHCWMDRRQFAEERFGYNSPQHHLASMHEHNATCLLWEGHKGPHRWTRDDRIMLRFVGEQ